MSIGPKRDAFLKAIGTRPVVMGILNLTPDSFSDGGLFQPRQASVSRAREMVAEGCDIVDIGGESTRPGATPVEEAEELRRIEAVVGELGASLDVPISIDTSKARVAERAAEMGAILVNDVWGLQKDPAMADAVAAAGTAVVIVHNRAEKDDSIDIRDDMRRYFDHSLGLAASAGVAKEHIILDPGIGFAKSSRQNIEAIAHIAELKAGGYPVLVGMSRKGFLGSMVEEDIDATLAGTVAASLAGAAAGADIFRVHDVAEHVAALTVFHAIRRPPLR